MIETVQQHRESFDKKLAAASDPDQLKQLRTEYLGKKGFVSGVMKEMRNLSPDEKRTWSPHQRTESAR